MMALMEIKTYEIRTNKIKKTSRTVRLVLLSDLHDRLWGEGQRLLLEAIDRLCPDLVLCAGDMLTRGNPAGMENALLLFEGLSKRSAPVIVCNGNHESKMRLKKEYYGPQYRRYARKLEKLGARILVNDACSMEVGFAKLVIHGYEMPLPYYDRFCRLPYDIRDLYRKFGRIEDEAFHILLAHNPVYFRAYARWGADLTLSGHLHGGIVRIPGVGGLITPQAKLFPRYDRGLFEEHGKYMAVSAGLGEHAVPFRICNPPQLIGILIKGTGEDGFIGKD